MIQEAAKLIIPHQSPTASAKTSSPTIPLPIPSEPSSPSPHHIPSCCTSSSPPPQFTCPTSPTRDLPSRLPSPQPQPPLPHRHQSSCSAVTHASELSSSTSAPQPTWPAAASSTGSAPSNAPWSTCGSRWTTLLRTGMWSWPRCCSL